MNVNEQTNNFLASLVSLLKQSQLPAQTPFPSTAIKRPSSEIQEDPGYPCKRRRIEKVEEPHPCDNNVIFVPDLTYLKKNVAELFALRCSNLQDANASRRFKVFMPVFILDEIRYHAKKSKTKYEIISDTLDSFADLSKSGDYKIWHTPRNFKLTDDAFVDMAAVLTDIREKFGHGKVIVLSDVPHAYANMRGISVMQNIPISINL